MKSRTLRSARLGYQAGDAGRTGEPAQNARSRVPSAASNLIAIAVQNGG